MQRVQHFVLTDEGELLRYPTIAAAKSMWIDTDVIYTCPEDMVERLTLDDMNYLYRRVTKDGEFKYRSKEVAAEKLFPVLCQRASPHNPFDRAARRKKQGKLLPSVEHDVHPRDGHQGVSMAEMRIHFAAPSQFDAVSPKITPQAYLLGRYLALYQPDGGYTWDGLTMDVDRAHNENILRTRQPPMRIFRYYADTLADHGLMYYTDSLGRPCDRPRNKTQGDSVVVRHPLKKNPGFLT